MFELAPERSAALRCLYVDYNVPVELLAAFSRFSQITLEEIIQRHDWQNTTNAQRRRAELNRVFDARVEEIAHEETSFAEHEKAGRALIALTKALEALEGLEEKSKTEPIGQIVGEQQKRDPLNADSLELFSRDVEVLVAALEAKQSASGDASGLGKTVGETQS